MPTKVDDKAKSTASSASEFSECIVCKEKVRFGARKCIHCDSFQDWREYFSFSSSILAWLVALVSVISLALPLVKDVFKKENSRVVLALQGIEDGYIALIASNLGTRPGSIGAVELQFDNDEGTMRHVFSLRVHESASGATLIKEGFSGKVQLTLNRFGYRTTRESLLGLPAAKCSITVEVVQFDGAKEFFHFGLPGDLAKEFLILHFDQRYGELKEKIKYYREVFLTNCQHLQFIAFGYYLAIS